MAGMRFARLGRGAALAALAVALAGPADAADDFYAGKTLRVVVHAAKGSNIDLYAQAVAKFIGRHLPGKPEVATETMEGAGGRIAANWLYTAAPRDGTVIGTMVSGAASDQATGLDPADIDITKFGWIGNPLVDTTVTFAGKSSGITVIDQVKTKGNLVCGSTSAFGPSTIFPQILGNLLGAKVRSV